MKAHQLRVIDEKRDLDEKAEKLRSFLDSSTARAIPPDEAWRLRVQYAIMDAYCEVLAARIAAFER